MAVYRVSFCLALLLALVACGQPATSAPQPCPTRPPVVTGINPLETFVAYADAIVLGSVGEGRPEVLVGRRFYQDWQLQVEQYLTDPLSHDSLVVRTFTGTLASGGNRIGAKSPTLAQGQRVLLFLDKDWDDAALAADEFTIVDLFGGTFWIRDDKVDIRYFDELDESPSKELDEVIRRIASIVELCR